MSFITNLQCIEEVHRRSAKALKSILPKVVILTFFPALVAPFLTRLHRINPLNTKSDQHLVSPYNNTAELFI